MLVLLAILIMLAVGYAHLVEGLFTASTMFVNVVLAGLIAFNFYEPAASYLEPMLFGTFLGRYEDAICLVLIFWLALLALRSATNNLAKTEIEFPQIAQRAGGAVFGLATGYLVSGMLVCVLQTLPMHVKFMGFEPEYEEGQVLRRLVPPDRVWLALMHRAGGEKGPFSNGNDTFDADASFPLRYARYRRYDDNRDQMEYYGEFDRSAQRMQSDMPPPPPLPGGAVPAPGAGNPPIPGAVSPVDKGKQK